MAEYMHTMPDFHLDVVSLMSHNYCDSEVIPLFSIPSTESTNLSFFLLHQMIFTHSSLNCQYGVKSLTITLSTCFDLVLLY